VNGTLKRLREAQRILDHAEREGRELTPEECQRVDELHDQGERFIRDRDCARGAGVSIAEWRARKARWDADRPSARDRAVVVAGMTYHAQANVNASLRLPPPPAASWRRRSDEVRTRFRFESTSPIACRAPRRAAARGRRRNARSASGPRRAPPAGEGSSDSDPPSRPALLPEFPGAA
jgi:hypothetical protein